MNFPSIFTNKYYPLGFPNKVKRVARFKNKIDSKISVLWQLTSEKTWTLKIKTIVQGTRNSILQDEGAVL